MKMSEWSAIQPYLLPELKSKYASLMSPEELVLLDQKLKENASKVEGQKTTAQKAITPAPDGKLKESPNSSASLKVSVPYTSEQSYLDTIEQTKAATQRAINRQEAWADQMEETLKGVKNSPRQIDFSALASYFDSIVPGSKLAQNYNAPETEAERQKRIFELENAIQKARDGISDKEIDATRALLNTHLYNKQIQAMGRQQRYDDREARAREDQIGKDLTKLSDEFGEDAQKLTTLEQNLSSGDYAKVSNSLSNFSRSIAGEKGVLTDADIARVLPKNFHGSLARFAAYFSDTPTAQLDPEYTKKLVELTQLVKEKTAARYMENLNQREVRWNNPQSKYYGVWNDVGSFQADAIKKRINSISSSGGGVDSKARLEELRKKYKRP